jgi:prophage maintenance system killer protein
MKKGVVIYQSENGEIGFRGDIKKETLWANLQQIADLFGRDKSVISRHITNIFNEEELSRDLVVAFFATTAPDGKIYQVEYFNLDVILSVGYRVNSRTATKFRQWATRTLRKHLIKGYTVNKKRISKNYNEFLKVVDTVKYFLPKNERVNSLNVLELIKMFSSVWLSLESYDKASLPKAGTTKERVIITAEELTNAIDELRHNLILRKEASELFARENHKNAILGIVGSVFQSVLRVDAYRTLEEKAAHLLYFFVKDHPFADGNKRCGAFAFVWYLNRAGVLNKNKITPEALTALTILVAESSSKDKERIIGLILHLL